MAQDRRRIRLRDLAAIGAVVAAVAIAVAALVGPTTSNLQATRGVEVADGGIVTENTAPGSTAKVEVRGGPRSKRVNPLALVNATAVPDTTAVSARVLADQHDGSGRGRLLRFAVGRPVAPGVGAGLTRTPGTAVPSAPAVAAPAPTDVVVAPVIDPAFLPSSSASSVARSRVATVVAAGRAGVRSQRPTSGATVTASSSATVAASTATTSGSATSATTTGPGASGDHSNAGGNGNGNGGGRSADAPGHARY